MSNIIILDLCVCANLEEAEVHSHRKLVCHLRPTERCKMHSLMKENHVKVYNTVPCAGPNAHMFVLNYVHHASKIHLSFICVVVSDSCNRQFGLFGLKDSSLLFRVMNLFDAV